LPLSGGLINDCLKAISKMVFSRASAASMVLMDPSWNAEIGMTANLSPQWNKKSSSLCLSRLRSRRKGRK
jgi:cbb3-type cytochrome oxidase subunit 1